MTPQINITFRPGNKNISYEVAGRKISFYYLKISASLDKPMLEISIVPSNKDEEFYLKSKGAIAHPDSPDLIFIRSRARLEIKGLEESIICLEDATESAYYNGSELVEDLKSFSVEQKGLGAVPEISITKSLMPSEYRPDVELEGKVRVIHTHDFNDVKEFMETHPDFLLSGQNREITPVYINGSVADLVPDNIVAYSLVHESLAKDGVSLEQIIASELPIN